MVTVNGLISVKYLSRITNHCYLSHDTFDLHGGANAELNIITGSQKVISNSKFSLEQLVLAGKGFLPFPYFII